MKMYNVTVNGVTVSTFETELEAYNAYSTLVNLLSSSEVEVDEYIREERGPNK